MVLPHAFGSQVVIIFPKFASPFAAVVTGSVEVYVTSECDTLNGLGNGGGQGSAVLPVDGTAGSFDGDDRPDIAIANQKSNNVSVALGQPDGTFADAIEYPTGMGPRRIVSGRFNADDHVDLITANEGNGVTSELSLLLGNGDGSFQAPVSVAAGTLPLDVAVGRFNADGNLDLVAADFASGMLVVRLGNGDGSFQSATSLPVLGFLKSLAIADLNRDTKLDIITSGSILLGNGDGSFQPAVAFATGLAPNVVRVGDVNDDAEPDVVLLHADGSFASVLLGNGDGSLQAARHYVTTAGPNEVAILDLDEDGRVDLVVSSASDDHLTVLRGNGDGTFIGASTYPSVADLAGRSGAAAVAVADFTGDDVPDVVAANGGAASLLPGSGGGRLGAATPITGLFGGRVIAGDWNGNGDQDLAVTSSSKLSIALGNGNGSFAAPTDITLPGSSRFHRFITPAFLDAGTVPDLVVANSDTGNVSIFLGDGSGGFTERPVVAIGTYPTGIAAGDFNGDDKVDLVVTNLGAFGALNGSLQLALGNGDGTFQAPQVLRSNNLAADSVVAADFDGDDHLDIAFVLESPVFDWDVEVLLGNGDGTFDAPIRLGLTYDLVHSVRTADFDQDGRADLVVAAEGTEVVALRGRGGGRFDEPVLFDTGGGAALPVDLDQDSLPDVVTASEVGVVAVLINVSDETGPAIAGDCDGDGRVTVAELVRGVRIALGSELLSACAAFDQDSDGRVSVSELVRAVAVALQQ